MQQQRQIEKEVSEVFTDLFVVLTSQFFVETGLTHDFLV